MFQLQFFIEKWTPDLLTMGATKVSGTDFLAIVSDRAENLGIGLEAQVMKGDNEIL